MPKYYVSSCDLKAVQVGDSPRDAAIKAFKRLAPELNGRLAPIIVVSEHGFDSYRDHDVVLSCEAVLIWAELDHLFENVE